MNNIEKFKTLQKIAALKTSLAKEMLSSSAKRVVALNTTVGVNDVVVVGKLLTKLFNNK
jgi:hypothetical protein